MRHLTDAVRRAVADSNWYAALALSLALPDICGRLERPAEGSKARYVSWCNTYLTPKYTHMIGPSREEHVFLHGEDCYALRCAVLHEGVDDIINQLARKTLDSFLFVAPPPGGGMIHCNQSNSKLQLQVDIFCEDICAGVDDWTQAVPPVNKDVRSAMALLMKIATLEGGLAF